MLVMERRTWPRLYVDLLKEAHTEGYSRPSREGETVEIGPALLKVPSPTFGPLKGREGSSEFARLEQLAYLAGEPPEALPLVAPRYARFREESGQWYGAYGPRLASQLPFVVRELTRHPFSRRAVAMIWRPTDISNVAETHPPKDIPCTISQTFWVGPAGDLRSLAHMRSCDLWFGLYYDLPAFAFLQRAVAKALQRPCSLTFMSITSLHLYNKHLDRVPYVKPQYMGPLVNPVVPPMTGQTNEERFDHIVGWAREELSKAIQVIKERMLEASNAST